MCVVGHTLPIPTSTLSLSKASAQIRERYLHVEIHNITISLPCHLVKYDPFHKYAHMPVYIPALNYDSAYQG